MEKKIQGRVWRFGPNVDTDQIIPAEYLVTGDPEELGRHAFERVRPDFAGKVKAGDVLIAGRNFGCGSSREHAPRALMGAGIACVVAESFARIFFRNAVNLGLPVVEGKVEAEEGDEVEIDFQEGRIVNLSRGTEARFRPLPPFLLHLMEAGGLVAYTRRELKNSREKGA
jgi:3-isopropylmalate/(R)-2-methylmalate dehydratase small subunit